MSNITVSICQSNYIPWRGYFDLIGLADYFIIFDSVQFTKNDWRNRNIIKTNNGAQWLTVPCKIKSIQQSINETEIAQTNWWKKHLQTLKTNYGKSPYFAMIYPWLEHIYVNQLSDIASISQINYVLLKEICKFLDIKTKIIRDTDLVLIDDKNKKLIHICEQLNANTYLSGPAAKDYLDEGLFAQHKINVKWMDYSDYEPYQQLFGEFNPYVSILDLMFNEGENSKSFLKANNG